MTKELFSIFKVENIVTSIFFFKKRKNIILNCFCRKCFQGGDHIVTMINETSVE